MGPRGQLPGAADDFMGGGDRKAGGQAGVSGSPVQILGASHRQRPSSRRQRCSTVHRRRYDDTFQWARSGGRAPGGPGGGWGPNLNRNLNIDRMGRRRKVVLKKEFVNESQIKVFEIKI